MEDALVSFLVNELTTVIKDEIQQKVRLVVGVEDEIKKLTKTFKAIQVVLKDAEHKQFQNEDVKLWLEDFKDVAYDMDDILDEWRTEMLIRSQEIGVEDATNDYLVKKVVSFLSSFCSCFGEVALRHDIGSRIKEVREKIDEIANEKDKYHLIEANNNQRSSDRLLTSSLVDESIVYGRNDEKNKIISKLLIESTTSSSSNQRETGLSNPYVISIVGMGGLGKTTLAQLVFNSEEVKNGFDKTMWVCVSDPFDLPRLAEAIIKEAGGYVPNNPEWNELHNALSKSVAGKKFMLVLDDVWSEDPIKWETMELALKSGAPGSQILVTTRNKKVAKIMSSAYIYDLEILSDIECWSLISRIAIVDRPKHGVDTLSGIGFEIAKKCKGLPLAAKALGGLLRFKNTETDWENVLESEIWDIEEVENNFLKPALLLSYFDLPSSLKPCFTYCSMFPKDYPLEKDILIKMWMAQGFLNSTGKREDDLEIIGEEYFNNLVLRSFFQDFYYKNGNIQTCKMHDLLHDFSQFLMKNDDITSKLNDHSKVRHLFLLGEHQKPSFDAALHSAKKLRTIQLAGYKIYSELPPSFFSTFSCLRVLSLRSIGLLTISSEIGNLIHLRYLNLTNNYNLKELPESITTLYNLQTLELLHCGCLSKLPEEMWRLSNLRYLGILACHLYLPQGFGKLTSLRTLTNLPLHGVTQSCKIEELKELNKLEGTLRISGLGGIKSRTEASEARLQNKNHLRFLELDFTGLEEDMSSLTVDRMNDVLEGLQPHPKLETLVLRNYMGSKFPSWIWDKSAFLRLKVLRLERCNNCTEYFPALRKLHPLEITS